MQLLRNVIGKHVRVRCSTELLRELGPPAELLNAQRRKLCVPSDGAGSGDITTRVLEVVKKFGRIESSKDRADAILLEHTGDKDRPGLTLYPPEELWTSDFIISNYERSAIEQPIGKAKVVSERADFHKDLFLDSLDRVELIMAIEQEFSVEIPDDKADNLSCCADVVKYIAETQKIN